MGRRWYADFKRGHTNTNDAECSGHLNSAVVLENTKKLHKLILADCKLKLCEIAEELKISEDSVFTILHKHLSMRNLCSKSKTTMIKHYINDLEHCLQLFQCNKKSFCINI